MSIPSNADPKQILTEISVEQDQDELLQTMSYLENYTVPPPSDQATETLIASLKPVLKATETIAPKRPIAQNRWIKSRKLPLLLQLAWQQVMLLKKGFILFSVLILLVGLELTHVMSGDMMKFLANAAPILGVLTVFYEFRAKLSGISEMEAACPYSAAQLATARLLVVLGYDILLCLLVTPLVSYWQGRLLGLVIVGWLAPLLLMLGIALTASLKLGIGGGCLAATVVWGLQLVFGKGESLLSLLYVEETPFFADMISIAAGLLLLSFTYRRWKAVLNWSDEPGD